MCKHVWFDQDTTKVVKHVTCLAQAHKVCKIMVHSAGVVPEDELGGGKGDPLKFAGT